MKKIFRGIAVVIGVFLSIFIGVGQYFYTVAIQRDTRQGQSRFDREIERKAFNKVWYESQHMEAIGINTDRGYELDGFIIYHPDSVQNTMIVSHGLGVDKWVVMKVAKMYMDAGFNTVFYDHTRHGSSEGDLISYGFYERLDMQNVVEEVKERFPGGTIGIHGESFGGATALMHAELNETKFKDVSFYVVDCPYSDLKDLFNVRLNEDFGLPNLGIIEMASVFTYMRHDFDFSDISPKRALDKIETPIMFIHGEEDTYIPVRMAYEMHKQKKGDKELFIVKGAKHARAYETAPVEYGKRVHSFIQRVMPTPIAKDSIKEIQASL